MESRLFIYFGLIFTLFFFYFTIRRIRFARRVAATRANIVRNEQIYQDSRGNEYTIYTIPHNGSTWQSPSQTQYQPTVHQHNPSDDLPPKYEDLVYQPPTNGVAAPVDTTNPPPRYIM